MIDELDPMKLLWGWAFGWDQAKFNLQPGRAVVEIYSTGPTGARRRIDCLCLTTDSGYHPTGREKPEFAAWTVLSDWNRRGRPDVEPLLMTAPNSAIPPAWQIAKAPPVFLWNVGQPWLDLMKGNQGFDSAFGVDPPLQQDFAKEFHDKEPPVFSHMLSGPTWHIPMYPAVFSNGSPFLGWLDRHKDRRFAVLLNYGEPAWPSGATAQTVSQEFERYKNRFIGYIAGESIAYEAVDHGELRRRVQAARSRGEILAAMRELYTAAVVKKFSGYQGKTLTAAEAWAPVISCLSAGMEAYAHALCAWGVRRIGHENTGNSPTLARRLAFPARSREAIRCRHCRLPIVQPW